MTADRNAMSTVSSISRRQTLPRLTRSAGERLVQNFAKAHLAWQKRVRPAQPIDIQPLPANALAEKRLACTIERQQAESSLLQLLKSLSTSQEHCTRHDVSFSVEAYLTLAALIARIVVEKVEDSSLVLRPFLCLADGFTDHVASQFRNGILKSPPEKQRALNALLDKIVNDLRLATGLGVEHLWRWEDIEILEQRGLIADWGKTHLVLPVQGHQEFVAFMSQHVLDRPQALFENLLQRATLHATSCHDGMEKSRENYAQIPLQWLTHLAMIIRNHPQTPGLENLNLAHKIPVFCREFFRFCPKIASLFSFELFFWPNFPVSNGAVLPLHAIQNEILQGLVDALDAKHCRGLDSMACDKTLFIVLSPLFSTVLEQQKQPLHRRQTQMLSPKQWSSLARRLRILPEPIRAQLFKESPLREKNPEVLKIFLGLDRPEVILRRRNPKDVDLELQD